MNDIGSELPMAPRVGLGDMKRLDLLCKQLKGKGVRVTGNIKPSRPGEKYTDYYVMLNL